MKISIVIPTLNEEKNVSRAIESSWTAGADEVIVVDGGSLDRTTDMAADQRAKVIETTCGRGNQLAVGGNLASGDLILFLHADNWIAPECLSQIRRETRGNRPEFFCFRQRIDSSSWKFRLIELGNAARVLFQQLPYGDQAMAVRTDLYRRIGGFKPIPLMEDVDLSSRLSRICRPRLLSGPVHVSQRRWESSGTVRQTLKNWWTMLRYRMGESPGRLARFYARDREASDGARESIAELFIQRKEGAPAAPPGLGSPNTAIE